MTEAVPTNAPLTVSLDAGVLGLSPGRQLRARELVTGRELSLRQAGGAWSVAVKLPAKDTTRVIRLATPSALEALGIRQAQDHLENARGHLRWAARNADAAAKPAVERALQALDETGLSFSSAKSSIGRDQALAEAGRRLAACGLTQIDSDTCARQLQAAQARLRP
jgi:hypothetical protein